jgi:hypothetical protein
MKTFLKTIIGAAILLTCSSAFSADISIGINIGPPPPPHVVRVLPPRPGPDFIWIEGYWHPVGNHYRWHGGYWTLAPSPRVRWIAPRHNGRMYFAGYWEDERGGRWNKHNDKHYKKSRKK